MCHDCEYECESCYISVRNYAFIQIYSLNQKYIWVTFYLVSQPTFGQDFLNQIRVDYVREIF